MHLGGIGSSTSSAVNSSKDSRVTNVGSSEDRPRIEPRTIPRQGSNSQEKATTGEKKYAEEEVIEGIEKANKDFVAYDRRFEFSIHEKTKQIMVKIIDSVTDEVIRELPPEKVLDMVAGLWEVAGIIVDKKI